MEWRGKQMRLLPSWNPRSSGGLRHHRNPHKTIKWPQQCDAVHGALRAGEGRFRPNQDGQRSHLWRTDHWGEIKRISKSYPGTEGHPWESIPGTMDRTCKDPTMRSKACGERGESWVGQRKSSEQGKSFKRASVCVWRGVCRRVNPVYVTSRTHWILAATLWGESCPPLCKWPGWRNKGCKNTDDLGASERLQVRLSSRQNLFTSSHHSLLKPAEGLR